MRDLLPCPFCGTEDITDIDDSKVGCTNCSAEAVYYDWNIRPKQSNKDSDHE